MGIIGAFMGGFIEGIDKAKADRILAKRFRDWENHCKLKEQGLDVIPLPEVERFQEYVEKLLAVSKKNQIGFR